MDICDAVVDDDSSLVENGQYIVGLSLHHQDHGSAKKEQDSEVSGITLLGYVDSHGQQFRGNREFPVGDVDLLEENKERD